MESIQQKAKQRITSFKRPKHLYMHSMNKLNLQFRSMIDGLKYEESGVGGRFSFPKKPR